mmetsp:Transcript_29114/g.44007  ORF Transcript_29114/g.44007 Transcript_29114/m.44007 type:complete len:112 (-) Transcript_29114:278-613(-)
MLGSTSEAEIFSQTKGEHEMIATMIRTRPTQQKNSNGRSSGNEEEEIKYKNPLSFQIVMIFILSVLLLLFFVLALIEEENKTNLRRRDITIKIPNSSSTATVPIFVDFSEN